MEAYQKNAGQVLEELGVSQETGLTRSQVEQSWETHGRNEFTRQKPKSYGRRILEALGEPMLILLLVAAGITVAVNIVRFVTEGHADWVECIGIFAAIALSVAITVVMEGRSAKAFEALSKIQEDIQVKVLRDGHTLYIPQAELAVGDIVYIETGDKLGADGRLLTSTQLRADESSLTGESLPAAKDAAAVLPEGTPVAERSNMLYSGCFITGGSGKMVVTAVGDSTEFGKIAKELAGDKQGSTPLQEKLAKMGKVIAILGASLAALVFLIQLIEFIVAGTATFETIADAFITSIVLIVASVPEGLPTIVAVSLAINIIKMSKQNALVKKMVACETIGSVNVICSDKTGTLTCNQMSVTDIVAEGKDYKPKELKNWVLLENFCLNSTADVEFGDRPQFVGNPTECALLVCAKEAGEDYRTVRGGAEIVHTYPFSSETKSMATIVRAGDGFTVYMKGSPERVLAACTSGTEGALARMEEFQAQASRVLAFAHKSMDSLPTTEEREEAESGLHFDGFVAISDPLRPDVKAAVDHCRQAGIGIKMLTGDNIVTARAIANQLGMLGDGEAVEARELEALSDEEFAARIPNVRVIARSTPGIKMRVVQTLKKQGNVVAVTGDGINDAPAIKNADVGIAMGITGTEVSKEASDIVLMDDSFTTIVRAVKWGRGIYENFQRFIQFQLSVNLSSVLVVLISILMGAPAPFTALELLWINIIMDGPPALTLGLEKVRDDLLKRKPTPRGASIVTKSMAGQILANGLFITIVFLCQSIFNFLGGTAEEQSTILFTLFVVFQLFNAFNSRILTTRSVFYHPGGNKALFLVFLLTFGLQIIITQFGGAVFGTVPLSFDMWLKIVGTGLSVVLFSEIVKVIRWAIQRRTKQY